MKIRTLGLLVGLSAVASSFLSCSQAKTVCTVGHAGSFVPYLVQLTPGLTARLRGDDNDPGALSSDGSQPTLDKMTSDLIGMETYHPPKTVGDDQPDFSKGTVAIQSDTLGSLAGSRDPDPDTNNKQYSIGDWKSQEPDANDFCQVPSFSGQTLQKFPLVPGELADPMDPMSEAVDCIPGVDVKYEWKDVQIYVTAAAQGTQFSADLTYTQVDHNVDDVAPDKCNPTSDATCQVTYKVRGLWPEVFCGIEVPDPTPMDPDNTKMVASDEWCCPDANPDPAAGRPIGSGINPDFPTKCDPDLLLCVLDAPMDTKLPILGGSKLQVCKDLAEKNK